MFALINQQNQLPQHHDVPQHSMDFDLSGSSMQFLRATGLDISLAELFQDLNSDSSSSTSSDATLVPNEGPLRFIVAKNQCATISLFHRKGLPNIEQTGSPSNLPPTFKIKSILIDKLSMATENAQQKTGMEIVPWQPCFPALLLQLRPEVLKATRSKTPRSEASSQEVLSPGAVGPSESGTKNFKVQTSHIRPSPSATESQGITNLSSNIVDSPSVARGRKNKSGRVLLMPFTGQHKITLAHAA